MVSLYSLFIRHVKNYFRYLFATVLLYIRPASCLETVPLTRRQGPSNHSYIKEMAASASQVSILIIDNDAATQGALQQVFDSEGWQVQVVPSPSEAMAELARGHWTLVLVSVGLANIKGPLFSTLREIAHADASNDDGTGRLRVLFLIPKLAARWAQPALERERLPYALKPFHLHDFLEKVSDLLLEAQAISEPIRSVRSAQSGKEHRPTERRSGRERRRVQMFASRDDYMMTEEEIAEYEKQEEEERKKREEEAKKREVL
jgi:DNA-binding response OmpR family regulator